MVPCLFDETGTATRIPMPDYDAGVWQPSCRESPQEPNGYRAAPLIAGHTRVAAPLRGGAGRRPSPTALSSSGADEHKRKMRFPAGIDKRPDR